MVKPYNDKGDLDGCQSATITAPLEHKSTEEPDSGQEVKKVIELKYFEQSGSKVEASS